jgi:LysM repeat protein
MNGLGNNAVLQPGQELAVGSNGAPRLHRVRPGDTWGGVAQRYGIPTSDLARANGRSTTDVIRVGEELQVPVDGN